jgi:hypothetical protein
MTVLLTCGHESALRESVQPNALWFCETCAAWQERDESNGLTLEDWPDDWPVIETTPLDDYEADHRVASLNEPDEQARW